MATSIIHITARLELGILILSYIISNEVFEYKPGLDQIRKKDL